jgi:putative ABC transport system ATP-binding protein
MLAIRSLANQRKSHLARAESRSNAAPQRLWPLPWKGHDRFGVAGATAFHAGEPMLQVRDLRTSILKPASFSLSAGEVLAVRGPSGAGKTLLLRAVADLDPSEGLATLDGRDRSTIAGPEWRRLVGYVPAEPGWWADTVGEHFGEWAAALAFINDLGFPNEAKAWPITRLSTGERLRFALARALMMRPKVLLLDEPTAALDGASVAAVEALINARLRTGLAVLWVTHDAEQAKRVAHRHLVVEAGQVREEAPEWTIISP